MMKHIYILAILLLCCACEAPLNLNRIDSSPCIMANGLIGNTESSMLYVKVAVPMNSEDKRHPCIHIFKRHRRNRYGRKLLGDKDDHKDERPGIRP